MNKTFTFEEKTFDIRVTQPGYDMYCVQTFMNNEPANHREICISYSSNDAFKTQYGYSGIEQLMRDEQLFIEQGNYYGSPYYGFERPVILITPSGVKATFGEVAPLTIQFHLMLPDGGSDTFPWSTSSERITRPGMGGPITQYRNEVLHAYWAWERNH